MSYRTFDARQIVDALGVLLPYVGISLLILLISTVIGMLLGLLLASMLVGRHRALTLFARVFMRFMRGAPAVVLLLLVFYGLPVLWTGIGLPAISQISRFVAVIITFALIASAQMANVFTAAYRAIPQSQRDAAIAVGYTASARFFRVILPQGIRNALPNLANTITWLLKEGAVAYTIGVIDLVGRAQLRISANYGGFALETYIALAIIFFLLIRIIELSFHFIEKKASRHLSMTGHKEISDA
ncbi:MAG TPA: ABC transporter permease subunit [Fastidiosipila sp.]|nr:ABC transporter permease subunit [Fastidiosipila sp.]